MDLVQGEVIKITEIIDKDWYRGESNGKTGIFPASFVRIIDSFPGDVPPDSADLSSYLKNPKRYHSPLLSSKLFGWELCTYDFHNNTDQGVESVALEIIFRENVGISLVGENFS